MVWNVNSTAKGGGVVELLRPLVGYARGAGVDARWVVIEGTPEFFAVTKRIHNRLHGAEGDGGALDEEARRVYESVLEENLAAFPGDVRPGDVVIVHDPQPAGLIGAMKERGAAVIWRCHVGIETPNDLTREAWAFLRPYVRRRRRLRVLARVVRVGGPRPRAPRRDPPDDRRVRAQERRHRSRRRARDPRRHRAGARRRARAPRSRSSARTAPPGRVERRARLIEDAPLAPGHARRAAGLALGRAEGSDRRHPRLRRARAGRHGRAPGLRRAGRRVGRRRPRGRARAARGDRAARDVARRGARAASTSPRCRWRTSTRTR